MIRTAKLIASAVGVVIAFPKRVPAIAVGADALVWSRNADTSTRKEIVDATERRGSRAHSASGAVDPRVLGTITSLSRS